jgi:hypothetical protein
VETEGIEMFRQINRNTQNALYAHIDKLQEEKRQMEEAFQWIVGCICDSSHELSKREREILMVCTAQLCGEKGEGKE